MRCHLGWPATASATGTTTSGVAHSFLRVPERDDLSVRYRTLRRNKYSLSCAYGHVVLRDMTPIINLSVFIKQVPALCQWIAQTRS
jgi:hypothetical protein